jgi:predicted enzyme related to lactoylglutathione lyase
MTTPRPNLTVIRCEDIEASAEFYRIVGLEFEKHRHGSGPEHYASLAGDWTFELYLASAKSPASSSTRIGFAVGSCDGIADRLRAAGFSLDAAPADSPWGRRAVAVDPDGHRVELSSPLTT